MARSKVKQDTHTVILRLPTTLHDRVTKEGGRRTSKDGKTRSFNTVAIELLGEALAGPKRGRRK